MKKPTSFLKDWGILIQIALVTVWVLSALQLGGPLKSYISKEMSYQSTRSFEEEREERKEAATLAQKLGDEATALGKNYTPERYFEDLEKLYQKGGSSSQIKRAMNNNLKKRIVTIEEMQRATKEFRQYNIDRISGRNEIKAPTLEGFTSWVSKLYFRTLLLVTIFYLVRMANRKGILETILANKTKFVLAIVFWPVLFTKYPYNVIREIRVETELRRFKDLFRKLSPKELVLVREIANSSSYKQWLGRKRKCNRGLILALTITILINLLPQITNAQSITETKTSSINCYEQIENDVGDQIDTAIPAILEEPPLMEPLGIIATIEKIESPWKSREPEDIDCIPEAPLFKSSLTKLPNQIAKGVNHEFNSKTRREISSQRW